ncbi:XLF-domain-containing protein [Biscogniauxia mediterranea]|nr:XLF-domain-containing protein [Biscogniauxia mediterranea]
MASTSHWYPLPAFPDAPTLLVSTHFASTSYTIHVTDLANVWVESLDRKAICLRSLQEDISIDLSINDPEQWAVFLEKLKAAFDPTSPDHHRSSLSLSASPGANTASQGGLTLYVTCVLPVPLKPLKWPVYLTKCPPISVTSELVLPLIQTHHAMTQDAQDLIHRLKEKDMVIAKLVDKLEAMSTGLEHVFNSLSGKRKVTRAMAEDKVKGLAPFNEHDWILQKGAVRESPKDVASLIQGVFGHSGLNCDTKMDLDISSQLSNWWTELGPGPRPAIRPRPRDSPQKPRKVSMPETTSHGEGDEDEFQVQATPPHLQSARKKLSRAQSIKNTSDSEDDSEMVPDSHPALDLEKPRVQVGAIGGRRLDITHVNPKSNSSRTILEDEDETASESDHDSIQANPPKQLNDRLRMGNRSPRSPVEPMASSSPPRQGQIDDGDQTLSSSGSDDDEPSKAQSPQRLSRKGGLGRIGGKSRAPSLPPEKSQEERIPGTRDSTTASPAKLAARKIGAIGSKAGADGKSSSLQAETESKEPESEEQKASRKRAELARELEKKAAAPSKKKRRF